MHCCSHYCWSLFDTRFVNRTGNLAELDEDIELRNGKAPGRAAGSVFGYKDLIDVWKIKDQNYVEK